MKITGTMVNYYVFCKRKCYLFSNKLHMEENSELVKIGKALHDEKASQKENAELTIESIRIDKITKDYLVEIKKSNSDYESAKWQLIFYLDVLDKKGITRKGKLQFIERVKGKTNKEELILELNEDNKNKLEQLLKELVDLVDGEDIPPVTNQKHCDKCSYYEYCYI